MRKSVSNINRLYKTNESESTTFKSIHEHICCLQKIKKWNKKKNKHAQQRAILAQTEMAAGDEFPPPTHKNPEAFNTRRGMGPLPGQTLGNVQHQLEESCIKGPEVGQLHSAGSHNNCCAWWEHSVFFVLLLAAESWKQKHYIIEALWAAIHHCDVTKGKDAWFIPVVYASVFTASVLFFVCFAEDCKRQAKWSVLMINRHQSASNVICAKKTKNKTKI